MAKWKFTDKDFLRCKVMIWDGDVNHCRACNRILTGKQKRWCSKACYAVPGENHSWGDARRAALRRDLFMCQNCGISGRNVKLEVNHIVPILGKHNENGCHHHQQNLETLCRPCHLEVTKQQREQGLFKK